MRDIVNIFCSNLKNDVQHRKRALWHMQASKTLVSLFIRTVWSESSLPAYRINGHCILIYRRTDKVSIRLRISAVWSMPSLFEYGISSFLNVVLHKSKPLRLLIILCMVSERRLKHFVDNETQVETQYYNIISATSQNDVVPMLYVYWDVPCK